MNWQEFVENHIPIVRANGWTLVPGDLGMEVRGQHQQHINHKSTVFGGSISQALILSAWAALRRRTFDSGWPLAVVVIQSEKVDFLHPVRRDFSAHSQVDEDLWLRCEKSLQRFGKARISVGAVLTEQGGAQVGARFQGDFVIFASEAHVNPTVPL